jgi:uncharacterized protein (TIGR00730 family)
MKSITIFCGSSDGSEDIYRSQAISLGKTLAQRNIQIVYGGAKVGLMGAVADAALDEGGAVTGVLPRFLRTREIAHERLSELIMVDSMHERKTKMHELSDGFIALPGGFGTLEELFEILTWAQLGLHKKPVGLLNVEGFYDHLQHLLNTMVAKGFLKEVNYSMLLVDNDIPELLDKMNRYRAPVVGKWITEDKV